MLKKLIKHEWAATWKIYGVIDLYLIIITVLSALTGIMAVAQDEPNVFVVMFALTVVVIFYISLIGAAVAPNLYSAMRFYKNFYSDEGYLMHTLPVGKNQLILSKLVVGLFWSFITSVIAVGSVLVIILSIASTVDNGYMLAEFWGELKEVVTVLQSYLTTPIWVFVVFYVLAYIISYASGVLSFYSCISLGQLAKRYKILMAIVAYVGVQTVMQFIGGFLQIPLQIYLEMSNFNSLGDVEMFMWIMLGFTFVLSAIFVAVFYAITYIVMKKKVNLD